MLGLAVHRKQDGGAGGGNPLREMPALDTATQILKQKLCAADFEKIMALENPEINQRIADAIEMCAPVRVQVCDDSKEDVARIRQDAIRNKEEFPLGADGHTVHFDHHWDQGRSADDTFLLIPEGEEAPAALRCKGRNEGLAEIRGLMDGVMQKGTQTMYIKFHTLGIGEHAVPCLEMTDSAYVGHSANLLYRPGYDVFKSRGKGMEFFTFVHSAGELDANQVPANVDRRRIAIDFEGNAVYSVNTQYAGNSLGMKKLALRLMLMKSYKDIQEGKEPWLCEHMYIGGIAGETGKLTYFAGDFPSGCGKTSTSMLETINGDDIAILFVRNGRAYAINYECGMFGILKDINPIDDKALYSATARGREVVYSNVLVYAEDTTQAQDDPHILKCVDPQEIWDFWNGKRLLSLSPLKLRAYWLGKKAKNSEEKIPDKGINHEGRWWMGKQRVVKLVNGKKKPVYWGPEKTGLEPGEEYDRDKDGNPVLAEVANKNARFCICLGELSNVDTRLNDLNGVPVSGIVSGGRAPRGMPPIVRAGKKLGLFLYYACLESLQTSAVERNDVGEGKPNFDPGAIRDFLPFSIGTLLKNNMAFYDALAEKPGFYYVNYFLEDSDGKFLNPDKNDKAALYKWAKAFEGHEVSAIETPIGYIPLYKDVAKFIKAHYEPAKGDSDLLRQHMTPEEIKAEGERRAAVRLRQTHPALNPDGGGSYSIEEYNAQFAIRVPELLEKIDRMIGKGGWYTDTIKDAPPELRDTLLELRATLVAAQEQFGDNITPDKFPVVETPSVHNH